MPFLLQRFCLQLKLHFYTPEKIAELKELMNALQKQKKDLVAQIVAAKRQKRDYEALGPEFLVIAREYATLLRDIEMEKQMMNGSDSFTLTPLSPPTSASAFNTFQ